MLSIFCKIAMISYFWFIWLYYLRYTDLNLHFRLICNNQLLEYSYSRDRPKPYLHKWSHSKISLIIWQHFRILVPLPNSPVRSTYYSKNVHNFWNLQKNFLRCYEDVHIIILLPRILILWNSLSAESFPLTLDLSGFKSRANRPFSSMGYF